MSGTSAVEYQALDEGRQHGMLLERLHAAEMAHYNETITLRLVEAQDGENKDQAVNEIRRQVENHARVVREIQAMIDERKAEAAAANESKQNRAARRAAAKKRGGNRAASKRSGVNGSEAPAA